MNTTPILHLSMGREKKRNNSYSLVSFAISSAPSPALLVECPRVLSLDLFSV